MSSSEQEEPIVTIEELSKLTAKQLKKQLQERGLPHSAKTKDILVKRLFRSLNSYDSTDDSSYHSDDVLEEITIPCADKLQGWVPVETEHVPSSFSEKDITNFYCLHKHPQTGSALNFSNMLTKANKLSNEHYVKQL